MYEVNEHITYGTIGVCRIVDICHPSFASGDSLFYVLQPIYDAGGVIYAKVDSDKVLMRRSLTRKEASSFIDELPEITMLWYDNDKERDSLFKELLRSGDFEQWIRMIKGYYCTREQKEQNGKRLSQADTTTFQKVEKLFLGELAYALDMQPGEVDHYIKEKCQEPVTL